MGHEQPSELDTRLAAFLTALPESMDCHGGYDDTKLTKIMRDECALAVTTGLLPPGTKVSVRKNHYRSFTVEIVAWSGALFVDAYAAHLLDPKGTAWDSESIERPRDARGWKYGRAEYVPALNDAMRIVERIVERHNYNNSDYQTDYFDVGYYMTVSANRVHASASAGLALESDPAYRALVQDATTAARTLGAACVRAVCGRGGITGCSQWALESLIKIAKRANGRPVVYDKRNRAWIPTDATPDQAFGASLDDAASAMSKTSRKTRGISAPKTVTRPIATVAEAPVCDHVRTTVETAPAIIAACTHGRTMDGGPAYVTPTTFCLDCGASHKQGAPAWSDGSVA